MSYSIQYSKELDKKYPAKHALKSLPGMKAVVIAVLIVVGIYVFASIGILRVLIPGDPEVTAAAVSCFVERVKTGEPVKDAVVLFFKDVVVNGA